MTKYLKIVLINSTALEVRIDVESKKPAKQITQNRNPVSARESGQSQKRRRRGTSAVPVSPIAETPQASNATEPQTERVLARIASLFLEKTPPDSRAGFDDFQRFMEQMRVIITGHTMGSWLITVRCDSLQILERLWHDYSSGHLGDVVQSCFVTDKILTELSLEELKLKTTISKEEYEACRKFFGKDPAEGNRIGFDSVLRSDIDRRLNEEFFSQTGQECRLLVGCLQNEDPFNFLR